jgi:hypothetical protein
MNLALLIDPLVLRIRVLENDPRQLDRLFFDPLYWVGVVVIACLVVAVLVPRTKPVHDALLSVVKHIAIVYVGVSLAVVAITTVRVFCVTVDSAGLTPRSFEICRARQLRLVGNVVLLWAAGGVLIAGLSLAKTLYAHLGAWLRSRLVPIVRALRR